MSDMLFNIWVWVCGAFASVLFLCFSYYLKKILQEGFWRFVNTVVLPLFKDLFKLSWRFNKTKDAYYAYWFERDYEEYMRKTEEAHDRLKKVRGEKDPVVMRLAAELAATPLLKPFLKRVPKYNDIDSMDSIIRKGKRIQKNS